jgi:murein DD-endopeptidase MepM/ murein hydrolase activator NlpD
VVQSSKAEDVVEAVSKDSIKKKAQIFFKIYEASWKRIGQEGQVAVYLYYGKKSQIPQTFIKKIADLNENLPLPIEYLEFEEKNRDGQLIAALIREYQEHGVNEFSPLLTSDFSADADSVAEHYKRIEELRSALTLYYIQELSEIEQKELAEAQGYESSQILIQELIDHQNKLGNNQADLKAAMTIPSLAAVLANDDYNLPGNDNSESNSLFSKAFRFRNSSSNRRLATKSGQISSAFKKLAGGKIKNEIAKTALGTTIKAAAGTATGGIATVALTLIGNKKVRQFAAYGTTYLVAQTLYAFSTIGGLILGTLGGLVGGLFGGPLGAIGGSIFGANLGAQIAPQQWGNWLGFTPRQPPGFESILSNTGVDSTTASFQLAKANAAATSNPILNTAQTGVTSSATTSQAAPAVNLGTPTTITAAIQPAFQGIWSYLTSLSIGVSAPLLALGLVILSTTYIIMIIAGAFVVPVPTRNTDWKDGVEGNKTQESEQFATITKVADITQIENNTPTDITYTVTITPKGNYSILVTDISDVFSGYGASSASNLVSPLASGNFPGEAFGSAQKATYTVKVGAGLVDSLVNNTLIVSFDAYDINGFVVGPNQNYRTSASVRVGDPKEGCWPTRGTIAQEPGGAFSHSNPLTGYYADAYDISGDIGTPIYAPFSGKLCRMVDNNIDADISKGELGYGRWVTLKAPVNGVTLELVFGHLNEAIIELGGGPSGDGCMQVSAQQVIAYMGNTGASTNPHLHYELRNYKAVGMRLQELVPPRTSNIVTDCHQ